MQMLLLNKTINGGLKPAVFSLLVRVEVCGGEALQQGGHRGRFSVRRTRDCPSVLQQLNYTEDSSKCRCTQNRPLCFLGIIAEAPPVVDKARRGWRSGQISQALQAVMKFGNRKREDGALQQKQNTRNYKYRFECYSFINFIMSLTSQSRAQQRASSVLVFIASPFFIL